MAEVFGVAAAAIGIAPVVLEVGKSVKKFKYYCHDIKNAPQDIVEFADEVQDLASVLAQLEDLGHQVRTSSGQLAQGCLTHCVRANKRILAIVIELERSVKKHPSRTRMFYPLKKDRLSELTQRLERAKSSLILACNICAIAISREEGAAQRQRLEHFAVLVQAHGPCQKNNLQHSVHDDGKSLASSRYQSSAILSPSFALLWLWDICANHAAKGWTHHFRTYRIISFNTPAMQMCRRGDLLELQRLLCRREVSLHDQDENGMTLFMTAAHYRQMHVARELFHMGADVSQAKNGIRGMTFHWLALVSYGDIDKSREPLYYREAFDNVRQDLLFLADDCNWGMDELDDSVNHVLTKSTRAWTAEETLAVLASNPTFWPHAVYALRNAMDTSLCSSTFWPFGSDHETRISHIFAISWACMIGGEKIRPPEWAFDLAKVIHSNSDIHAACSSIETRRGTPMQIVLCFARMFSILAYHVEDIASATLKLWVESIAAAGVDLLAYGQKEEALWTCEPEEDFYCQQILGFSYGSSIDDWNVFVEHPGDRFAGIFWDMIEHPERTMPGSWNEPERYLWEDQYFERQRFEKYYMRFERWEEQESSEDLEELDESEQFV